MTSEVLREEGLRSFKEAFDFLKSLTGKRIEKENMSLGVIEGDSGLYVEFDSPSQTERYRTHFDNGVISVEIERKRLMQATALGEYFSLKPEPAETIYLHSLKYNPGALTHDDLLKATRQRLITLAEFVRVFCRDS